MTYSQFRSALSDFPVISLADIRAVDPAFDRRRLTEWQEKGYLRKVVKGHYVFSETPLDEQKLFEIAVRIYRPSYVSLESALSHHGLIPESVYAVTAVSTRRTYRFDTPISRFSYRTVKPRLFFGFTIGPGLARLATVEKAVLDYLYLNPHMDGPVQFSAWRLNRDVCLDTLDDQTFSRYLARCGGSALSARPGDFSSGCTVLDLPQLLSFYPERLHPFRMSILLEYLQYKILESLYSSSLATPLVFMGGTCIHLVHGNPRFSEDLDFDNRGLSAGEFDRLSHSVAGELRREGYSVELKTSGETAFHAWLRFTNILQEVGLTGHREEKLLIRIDTEPQEFDYRHDQHILNRFDVFLRINVVPPDVLLAQKLDCILNRKRPIRRDFFGTVFLVGKTRPSFDYLKQKLAIDSEEELKSRLLTRCEDLDFKQLAGDIEPFIFNSNDTKKVLLFPEFVESL